MIGLVDIGVGNLGSLNAALKKLNIPYKSCKNISDFNKITKIILPGVGSFDTFMFLLKKKKLDIIIKDLVGKNYPILGICLGFQILFEKSEEGTPSEGLSLLKGKFINLRKCSKKLKVPHTGWNQCSIIKNNKLFKDIPNNSDFYFTHTFVLDNYSKEDVLTKTEYGFQIVSSISKKNLYGVQFHPEKSQINGLKLIKNFFVEC